MSCYCDYETPEFYREATQKARKQHRCCECGCNISVGDVYELVVGKWDGFVSRYKTCPSCLDFRKWYSANRPCVCWCFSELFDAVSDDVENDWDTMVKEAPGFLFQVGRRYVAIRNKARADKAARDAAKSFGAGVVAQP